MLVIRFIWLQAALVMAQLPTLDDVLAIGGGDDASNSEVAAPVQSQEVVVPSVSLEDLLAPDASAAATNENSGPNLIDDLTSPTGILDLGEAAPATSADPQVVPTSEAVSVPAPESVEPVVETSAAALPAPQSTAEPTPVTEQGPPVLVPDLDQEDEEEDEENSADEIVQQPVASAAPAPNPVAAPESSAAAALPASSAEATNGGAGVFVPPAQASSAAPAPEESGSQPQSTAPAALVLPQTTTAPTPAASEAVQEPILTLVTSPESTFLSVFVPPSPTQVLAALDNPDFPSSIALRVSTDPNGLVVPLPTNSASLDPNSNPNGGDPLSAPDDSSNPDSDPSRPGGGSSDSDSLPMSTKIGLGVGLGVGSIVLVVIVVYILWKKRMAGGGGEPRWEDASSGSSSHKKSGSDVEKGAGMGFDARQKLDWESEHDVAFDFGFGGPPKREVSLKKKAEVEGGVEGVLAGVSGVGVAVGGGPGGEGGYRR